jgi:RNAse (barnase) inhibitor barstar
MIDFFNNSSNLFQSTLFIQVPKNIRTKAELFHFLSTELKFPDYFGKNWDALEECIGDLSWLPKLNVHLVHQDIPLSNQPEEAAIYISILEDVEANKDHCTVTGSFPIGLESEVKRLRISYQTRNTVS